MSYDSKILVVGTTSDYIDIIRRFSGGSALFITEPDQRMNAFESCPDAWEEVLSEFQDPETLFCNLDIHLKKYKLSVSGITAFDCESLLPASYIAEKLKLPFTSAASIKNCRDKFISKKLWKASGIKTPETEIINSQDEALCFFRNIKSRCVIKPKTGAGSELMFLCADEAAIKTSYDIIARELEARKNNRLYNMENGNQIIIEEFIDAPEYSADFTVNGDRIEIIRLTQKIKRSSSVFGITTAYLLLNAPPPGINTQQLQEVFLENCKALGISNAICMMDFFVKDGEVFLLETAPRPGGDCIPFLLEKTAGLNMLKEAMDFSTNPRVSFGDISEMEPGLGIRIIADRAGIFENVDTSRLEKEKNIKAVFINRKPGSEILMPPDDYDSWILGCIIAEREKTISPEQQVNEVLSKIHCKIVNK